MTTDKIVETIKYTVYRSHLEPVIEQTSAEINLYPNHLELIYNYRFTVHETQKEDFRRAATLVHKRDLSISLSSRSLEGDAEDKASPIVQISINGAESDTICVESTDEAYKIYSKIKKWMLK